MSALKLVNELKENNEDYEFYPTTREIIETLYWDINGRKSGEECFRGHYLKISLLDIGAGNCKLFNTFKDIAESQPLLDEFVYRRIDNAEFYKECTLIKVKGLENYHTKIRCEYKHPQVPTYKCIDFETKEVINSNILPDKYFPFVDSDLKKFAELKKDK